MNQTETKPGLLEETILNEFRVRDVASTYPIKILGVRGFLANENQIGIYDDLICLSIEGQPSRCFSASTDPGKFYIDHPVNPSGCAQLNTGLWWYQMGQHLGKHVALTQAEPVTVDRLDWKGGKVGQESGYFGINIHSGGAEYQVGRWSAGCQVIESPEGAWNDTWISFISPILEWMPKKGQTRIPYLLVDKLQALPMEKLA